MEMGYSKFQLSMIHRQLKKETIGRQLTRALPNGHSSMHALVKNKWGFKGNKESVLKQFEISTGIK